MPAILVTRSTVTQNSQFSSLAVSVNIASTHHACPIGGMARLSWHGWLHYILRHSIPANGRST